jgi:hypothetical protein
MLFRVLYGWFLDRKICANASVFQRGILLFRVCYGLFLPGGVRDNALVFLS